LLVTPNLNLVSSVICHARGARDHEVAAVLELDGSRQILEEEGRGEAEVEGWCSKLHLCWTSMAVMRCWDAVPAGCGMRHYRGPPCLVVGHTREKDHLTRMAGQLTATRCVRLLMRRPMGLVPSRAGRRRHAGMSAMAKGGAPPRAVVGRGAGMRELRRAASIHPTPIQMNLKQYQFQQQKHPIDLL